MNGTARQWFRICVAALVIAMGSGCGTLRPKAAQPPALHSLDAVPVRSAVGNAAIPPAAAAATLLVNAPHAAAGFDSRRIIYVRSPHKFEYFALNEWVDTPARMLAPLIVSAVEQGGAFHAVVLAPSVASGDLRLDTEIIRLQQNFDVRPSTVRFTLRAYVMDDSTRRVLVSREFDVTVDSASENPYGGVVAANRAVQGVLEQLARLCVEALANWKPLKTEVLE